MKDGVVVPTSSPLSKMTSSPNRSGPFFQWFETGLLYVPILQILNTYSSNKIKYRTLGISLELIIEELKVSGMNDGRWHHVRDSDIQRALRELDNDAESGVQKVCDKPSNLKYLFVGSIKA